MNGAHEQLPSSSPTRSFGKRSRIPPEVKQVATNMMPSGWLNGCHSMSLSRCSLKAKSGLRDVMPPPWKQTGRRGARPRARWGRTSWSCQGRLSTSPGRDEAGHESPLDVAGQLVDGGRHVVGGQHGRAEDPAGRSQSATKSAIQSL